MAGTVLAAAAPAVTVVSLDITGPGKPQASPQTSIDFGENAVISTTPVDPVVREVPVSGVDETALHTLTAYDDASGSGLRLASGEDLAALSTPEPVEGYATVGVTWDSRAENVGEMAVSVRTLDEGRWSAWEEIENDAEHGPDPGSQEARNARPGTDPVAVGNVDEVQVKATTETGEAPEGMTLALIDPGVGKTRVNEEPEIDTAELASATVTEDSVTLTSARAVTSKPRIFSRRQWGADESLRGGSPRYFEVQGGFVHHTVNANSYTREQVPALLRGIYAYHTQSRGWSDIGYNFIVDRFGRIWEGRAGGVDRPVVGAHTSGYNEYSFAMSALGNFETARPSAALVRAYAKLFAWKLSLHGIDASDATRQVGRTVFKAINGHSDADSTACPGRYLYEKLGQIRRLAAEHQRPFDARARQTSITGVGGADIVARDAATKRVYLLRTGMVGGGGVDFERRRRAANRWGGKDLITPVGDVTRDDRPDIMARDRRTKVTRVYPGQSDGDFGPGIRSTRRYRHVDALMGAGDMNQDGLNDLVARDSRNNKLYFYEGRQDGKFRRREPMSRQWGWATAVTAVGDMSGDGLGDLLVRDRKGRLSVRLGDGRGDLSGRIMLRNGNFNPYDIITGRGDLTGDGVNDLLVRSGRTKVTTILPGRASGGVGASIKRSRQFRGESFLATVDDVTGDGADDLVGRGRGGNLVVFPTKHGGRQRIDTGVRFPTANAVLNVGDWNGDGFGDVVTRSGRTGNMWLYSGDGNGRLHDGRFMSRGFGPVRLLTAVGDATGDGNPDLMGQPRGGAMRIYPGNGANGFKPSYVAHSALAGVEQIGAGLWNSDGAPDTIIRRGDGTLLLYPGNGPGGLMDPVRIGGGANRYDAMAGVGDLDGNGSPDIVARERSTGQLWKLLGPSMRRERIGPGYGRYDLLG